MPHHLPIFSLLVCISSRRRLVSQRSSLETLEDIAENAPLRRYPSLRPAGLALATERPCPHPRPKGFLTSREDFTAWLCLLPVQWLTASCLFFLLWLLQMPNPIGFTATKELQEDPLHQEHEATRYAQWKVWRPTMPCPSPVQGLPVDSGWLTPDTALTSRRTAVSPILRLQSKSQ